MQKHFLFVSIFEHLNFASNENIPTTYDIPNFMFPL